MKKLMIVGASGHGKVVADIAKKNHYNEIAFLDDNPGVKICAGYDVVGPIQDFKKKSEYDFFVAIGNSAVREKIHIELLKNGLNIVTLVHPNATIAPDVKIGVGTVVVAGAVINPGAIIGQGCIVNTGSTIDHDDVISDFVHISVGCHVAGTVRIGERTWLGAGAIVSNNINICENCMIGAGAVVIKNIDMPGTYVGVPAKMI